MSSLFAAWLRSGELHVRQPYVIAEIGVNHNGDLASAHALVDIAADAGAQCAKFQVFHSESVAASGARTADYQLSATDETSQLDMIRHLELPDESWIELKQHCDARGIDFIATAFDDASLDLVDALEPAAHKVPSGEITNLPYLKRVAALGRPVLLSTGMSNTAEVETAIATLGRENPLVVLHCISAYPTPWTDSNLLAIPHLHEVTGLPVGWSDHTVGNESALMALALGSRVFEKHITQDRGAQGPDHAASADPADFEAYVRAIADGVRALGQRDKHLMAIEEPTIGLVRRSWHARRDIAADRALTEDDLIALRPETGISTIHTITGRRVSHDIASGDPVTDRDLG